MEAFGDASLWPRRASAPGRGSLLPCRSNWPASSPRRPLADFRFAGPPDGSRTWFAYFGMVLYMTDWSVIFVNTSRPRRLSHHRRYREKSAARFVPHPRVDGCEFIAGRARSCARLETLESVRCVRPSRRLLRKLLQRQQRPLRRGNYRLLRGAAASVARSHSTNCVGFNFSGSSRRLSLRHRRARPGNPLLRRLVSRRMTDAGQPGTCRSLDQTRVRGLAAQCARAVDESSAQRGRGERRMPVAPAASCALGIGRTHTSNNEYTGITRHSRTQWF